MHQTCWNTLSFSATYFIFQLIFAVTDGSSFSQSSLHSFLRKPSSLGLDFIDHIRTNHDAVHLTDKDGYLPIHIACMSKCNIDIVNTLLQIYPESVLQKDLKNNQLPIHHLTEEKSIELDCLRALLLHYPLSAGVKDKAGKLPLHYALSTKAEQSELMIREVVIMSLVEAYPLGASVMDNSGKLPVTYAIDNSASETVITLLLKAYPEGAHALLIKAIEVRKWREAEDLLHLYPAAAGVRSKNGKILPLGVAVSKKAPLSVINLILSADPGSAAADEESVGGFDFMATMEAAYKCSPFEASQLLYAVLPINQKSGEEYSHHSGF
jgi:ankyrin repeat protein